MSRLFDRTTVFFLFRHVTKLFFLCGYRTSSIPDKLHIGRTRHLTSQNCHARPVLKKQKKRGKKKSAPDQVAARPVTVGGQRSGIVSWVLSEVGYSPRKKEQNWARACAVCQCLCLCQCVCSCLCLKVWFTVTPSRRILVAAGAMTIFLSRPREQRSRSLGSYSIKLGICTERKKKRQYACTCAFKLCWCVCCERCY